MYTYSHFIHHFNEYLFTDHFHQLFAYNSHELGQLIAKLICCLLNSLSEVFVMHSVFLLLIWQAVYLFIDLFLCLLSCLLVYMYVLLHILYILLLVHTKTVSAAPWPF